MSIVPMALVVFSAILHAGWNILGKNNRGSGMAFTLAASATAAVILTPYIMVFIDRRLDNPSHALLVDSLGELCVPNYLSHWPYHGLQAFGYRCRLPCGLFAAGYYGGSW